MNASTSRQHSPDNSLRGLGARTGTEALLTLELIDSCRARSFILDVIAAGSHEGATRRRNLVRHTYVI
jgi:hypothetical protein